jgi:CheY-like chemotaxis protein
MALNQLGCTVTAVENGQEVLDALSKQPYEVVFMDVEMPVMDGLEATRQLRQRHDITQPIVIAYTANADNAQQERCREAGMDDFVSKPIDVDELATILEKHNTRNSSAVAGVATVPRGGSVRGPATANDVLDTKAINNLRKTVGDHPDSLIMLIDTFMEDMMKQIANLQNAASAQDATGMMMAAHSLKSLGNNFGATQFASLSRDIEFAARDGDIVTAQAQLPTLLQAVEPVVTALSQLKAEVNA